MPEKQLNAVAAIFDRIEAELPLTEVFEWAQREYLGTLSTSDLWDIFDFSRGVEALADVE